jgi:pyrimidine deaminase RibD-like protein
MTEQVFMQRAVALALEKMRTNGGGPFGAVIVRNNTIISEGWNEVTSSNDPTAHAEIVAIRRACALLGAFNLPDCDASPARCASARSIGRDCVASTTGIRGPRRLRSGLMMGSFTAKLRGYRN